MQGGDVNRDRNRKEEKTILEMRVTEKKKEIEDLRKKWEAETKRVTRILDLSFQGSERMRILIAEELKKF